MAAAQGKFRAAMRSRKPRLGERPPQRAENEEVSMAEVGPFAERGGALARQLTFQRVDPPQSLGEPKLRRRCPLSGAVGHGCICAVKPASAVSGSLKFLVVIAVTCGVNAGEVSALKANSAAVRRVAVFCSIIAKVSCT